MESKSKDRRHTRDRPEPIPTEQAETAREFLTGLVDSLGLEGDVEIDTDDRAVIANVVGEQTAALVGNRGYVMHAVHELTRTVLQRTHQSAASLRLDIAGYAERRRQALTIYANELIDQVLEDGGEIMLESMSPADRKVIHDAVGEREGARTFSEGEAPNRYVVIAEDKTE